MTLRSGLTRKKRHFRGRGCVLAILCGVVTGVSAVQAAQVRGTLVAYEGGVQQGGRYLHFQNEVTRDCYMVPTATDGGFGAELPPGVYDLRAERGAMLARAIVVGRAAIGLGQVNDLAPYAPARLWHLQAIAPSMLSSPAPSTANLLTADMTVPPPGRMVVAAPALDPSGCVDRPYGARVCLAPRPAPGQAPSMEPR